MVDPSARYRAEQRINSGPIESWVGHDDTLHRPVTIRTSSLTTEHGQRLRLQAHALARLEHPGLLHVLDTSTDEDRFSVITEALPERRLSQELAARGHLHPAEAVETAIEIGDALAALHRAGFAHGGVTPEGIGRRENGRVVVLDGPPTDDAVRIPATPADDLQSLAVLTHVLLVGNPPIISPDGHHDLHPAVPGALRGVLLRSFDEHDPWIDTTSFVLALRDKVPLLPAASAEFDESPPASFFKAERAWFAPVGVLLIAAAVILAIGIVVARTEVGQSIIDNAKDAVGFDETTIPTTEGEATLLVPRPTTPSAALDIIAITDFDPAGDDRAERPERLGFINNGDGTAGWHTERYSTRDFGNLKEGVGLILTFGPPQQLDRIEITSPSLDWSVEIYASDTAAGTVVDWGSPVAARVGVRGSVNIALEDVSAATVLIWIVDLGDEVSSGGHRVTITDIDVEGRPLFG